MSNEFDYSGLYNHTTGEGAPQGNPPADHTNSTNPQNNQPEQSSYPNVGSSGMNTANTAKTDYSTPNPTPQQSSYTGTGTTGSPPRNPRSAIRCCCGYWPVWALWCWASAAVLAGPSWPAVPA